MTTKQRTNHDNFSLPTIRLWPTCPQKGRTPARSNSRHKLHHQIARSCSRSAKNPVQQFSSHGASRTVMELLLLCRNKPYPLSGQGFYGSPIARRKLRGVPRDGRAMGAKHPARNPAKCLASYPRNVPAMAGQWQRQCRRTSVKTTRKTTCLAPDLDAQCPRRKLARQLATWPRNSRATVKATSRKQLVGISPSAFNHDIQKL